MRPDELEPVRLRTRALSSRDRYDKRSIRMAVYLMLFFAALVAAYDVLFTGFESEMPTTTISNGVQVAVTECHYRTVLGAMSLNIPRDATTTSAAPAPSGSERSVRHACPDDPSEARRLAIRQ